MECDSANGSSPVSAEADATPERPKNRCGFGLPPYVRTERLHLNIPLDMARCLRRKSPRFPLRAISKTAQIVFVSFERSVAEGYPWNHAQAIDPEAGTVPLPWRQV